MLPPRLRRRVSGDVASPLPRGCTGLVPAALPPLPGLPWRRRTGGLLCPGGGGGVDDGGDRPNGTGERAARRRAEGDGERRDGSVEREEGTCGEGDRREEERERCLVSPRLELRQVGGAGGGAGAEAGTPRRGQAADEIGDAVVAGAADSGKEATGAGEAEADEGDDPEEEGEAERDERELDRMRLCCAHTGNMQTPDHGLAAHRRTVPRCERTCVRTQAVRSCARTSSYTDARVA